MVSRIKRMLREWSEMRRFNALGSRSRSIVFYAEDKASWSHLGPLVRELTEKMDRQVCYLTSDTNDPILSKSDKRIHAFCIGDGMVRTMLFMSLKADVCVMTMPDLQTFHIKRSKIHPVHYVYVFHSMVSTHMIYRKSAFDHFDTVFCVGPHHAIEIRKAESINGLTAKHLLEHGYGRLDTLLAEKNNHVPDHDVIQSHPKRILVAPSWGPNGLLENHGLSLTPILLDAGFHVTVRPHPMTVRHHRDLIRALKDQFGSNPRFVLETDVASSDSLRSSDLMVGDYSGAALEYAFVYERPVLFVDMPRKINNPDYERIDCEPLEVGIRQRIGDIVRPEDLSEIPAVIERLCSDPCEWSQRIRQVRAETVYHIGRSASVGARHIVQWANNVIAGKTIADSTIRAPSTSEGLAVPIDEKPSLALRAGN